MGVIEVQHALAELYTNAEVRARFFSTPLKVGKEFGLSESESCRLAQIPAAELDSFAASLVNKRLGEVVKLLPLTYRICGENFVETFRRYAATHVPPRCIKKHIADALDFARYIGKIKTLDPEIAPELVRDLLRFETARLIAANSSRHLVVRFFRYDVVRLAENAAREDTNALDSNSIVRQGVAVWWRFSSFAKFRLFNFPKLWRA
ncbi:MAG: hypothetical protein NVSMB56_16580 [Pyrinomonadaceae bacterium]